MKPYFSFSEDQRELLLSVFETIKSNPYLDHKSFFLEIESLLISKKIPSFFGELCGNIKHERKYQISDVHVIRNCPIDEHLPRLNNNDPLNDKYQKKKTFVGEAFLATFSALVDNPLLAYEARHNGDFFTDVIANNRYEGKLTGFSDGELVFHNDRTAHPVRADYISLLGLICPKDDLIYTSFIHGKKLLEHLSPQDIDVLRKPYFRTQYDIYSRDISSHLNYSEPHPILEGEHSFRYLDTMTGAIPSAPIVAKDALISFKNSVARVEKIRHRILTGDLFVFANQNGLHNREKIDVLNPASSKNRWLLKTYAFESPVIADQYVDRWVGGVVGRVAD